jgi:hypothetical protein
VMYALQVHIVYLVNKNARSVQKDTTVLNHLMSPGNARLVHFQALVKQLALIVQMVISVSSKSIVQHPHILNVQPASTAITMIWLIIN